MNYDLEPPNASEVELIANIFKPWEWLTSPKFYGLDNIPSKGPVLFVGNHTIMGGLDVPLIWLKLYREKEIFLRMLVDHAHFKIPVLRDFLAKFGEVDGTRENAADLLRKGQYVLVFPGGSREAFKRKGEAYQLIWRHHLGFAKMAIKFGCTIVPMASVGPEECYEIVYDSEDYLNSPFGGMIKKLGIRKDLLIPIVKGIGPTLIPRPQRFYTHFGSPILTDHFNYKDSKENAMELREVVQDSLERDIEFLKTEREKDPKKELLRRVFPFEGSNFFSKKKE